MPQMAPLPWVTMFVLSITLLIVVMTITYFICTPSMDGGLSKETKEANFPTWKW
uniref:ATP synthase complex subunit 8 n=1 Tax=Phallocryptus tserensodnomi TaxID=1383053 RepID=A0A0U1ZBE6_9CRUS|nr:ATP synthase F0 subunit 8 [Phallocryptus tserensodnomi]AJP76842.1 ATP synthase F0 subunit 8 [Phallocryptus tserensodnomi]